MLLSVGVKLGPYEILPPIGSLLATCNSPCVEMAIRKHYGGALLANQLIHTESSNRI
jgi:hypothetical protein